MPAAQAASTRLASAGGRSDLQASLIFATGFLVCAYSMRPFAAVVAIHFPTVRHDCAQSLRPTAELA
jgi:hypothetical protein